MVAQPYVRQDPTVRKHSDQTGEGERHNTDPQEASVPTQNSGLGNAQGRNDLRRVNVHDSCNLGPNCDTDQSVSKSIS